MRRLMIHYPLDEIIDGKTPDVVSGYDMELRGVAANKTLPSLVDGVSALGDGNKGLFFDNSITNDPNRWGQYATAGDVDVEDMGDGMTISLWVNQGNRSSYHGLLSRRVSWSATGMMWQLEFQQGSGLGFMRNGATNPGRLNFANDEWRYIVVTVDKNTNTQKVYLDGALQRTQTPWTFGTGSHAELKMGCNQATTTSLGDPFYGVLDDVKFYNYARSAEQVAKDYLTAIGSDGYICNLEWPALKYDLNNDCQVDLEDLVLLVSEWLDDARIYAE